ncbi:GEM-like protein 4 [Linum perenne]
MKASYHQEQVIGVPMTSFAAKMAPGSLLLEDVPQRYIPTPAHKSLMLKQTDKFAHGIREHVKLGSKISETLKGKLSLGARILQVGGVKKVFRQLFSVGEGERLLKACQCYLSTNAGPIAGLLFISTHKLAFCSERSIQLSSPEGKSIRVHYKVLIPLEKIEMANQSENVKNPSQKYMEIVTVDGFDFWFMGFLSYKKAFKYLEKAISSRASS